MRKFNYYKVREVSDSNGVKHTVIVYGEASETDQLDGIVISKVKVTRKGRVIKSYQDELLRMDDSNPYYSTKKTFNMGYSICNAEDELDIEKGIRWAKKRFAKSPMTTQNGNFLTKDMVKAIIDNEAEYIALHIDKFIDKLSNKK